MTKLFKDTLNETEYKTVMSLWEQTKKEGQTLDILPAPGVNTSMIFSTLYETGN